MTMLTETGIDKVPFDSMVLYFALQKFCLITVTFGKSWTWTHLLWCSLEFKYLSKLKLAQKLPLLDAGIATFLHGWNTVLHHPMILHFDLARNFSLKYVSKQNGFSIQWKVLLHKYWLTLGLLNSCWTFKITQMWWKEHLFLKCLWGEIYFSE